MFCKKCGYELPEGSVYCPKCGVNTAAGSDVNDTEQKNNPQENDRVGHDNNNNAENLTNQKAVKKRTSTYIVALVVVCFLGIGAWVYFSKTDSNLFLPESTSAKIERIDLASQNGVPEPYSLKWGMSFNEVRGVLSSPVVSESGHNNLFLSSEDVPECLDLKPSVIFCQFSNKELFAVTLGFSCDQYSLEKVKNVFVERYGEPTEPDDLIWKSERTLLYISKKVDPEEIWVSFYDTASPGFGHSAIDDLDPLGLISFLGTPIIELVSGLEEGTDYFREDSPVDMEGFEQYSYSTYTFFADCELLDYNGPNLFQEITTELDSQVITIVSYKLFLDNDDNSNNVEILKEIDTCVSEIANNTVRERHPTGNSSYKEYTNDRAMYADISGWEDGTYFVQWEGDYRISLRIELRPDYQYSIATLSFA